MLTEHVRENAFSNDEKNKLKKENSWKIKEKPKKNFSNHYAKKIT